MKKILFSTMLLGGLFAASAQTISADVTTLEYGKIKKGEDGARFFTITNKGDKPLQITKATAGCGCTTPQAPTEPIAPGASAKVKVGYDTSRIGAFNKNVDIESNDPATPKLTLFIAGEVLGDPTAPNPSFNPAALPAAPAAPAALSEQVKATTEKVKSKTEKVKAKAEKVKASAEKAKATVTSAKQTVKETLPPPPPAPANPHAGHGH